MHAIVIMARVNGSGGSGSGGCVGSSGGGGGGGDDGCGCGGVVVVRLVNDCGSDGICALEQHSPLDGKVRQNPSVMEHVNC